MSSTKCFEASLGTRLAGVSRVMSGSWNKFFKKITWNNFSVLFYYHLYIVIFCYHFLCHHLRFLLSYFLFFLGNHANSLMPLGYGWIYNITAWCSSIQYQYCDYQYWPGSCLEWPILSSSPRGGRGIPPVYWQAGPTYIAIHTQCTEPWADFFEVLQLLIWWESQ